MIRKAFSEIQVQMPNPPQTQSWNHTEIILTRNTWKQPQGFFSSKAHCLERAEQT